MKKFLPVNPKEKRLLWVIIGFFLLAMLTIGIGIYNQSNGINQDRILIPVVLLFFGGMFLSYSYAAFKLYKFVTDSFAIIYPFIVIVFKHITTLSEDECKNQSTRLIGILLFIISLVFIVFAIYSLSITKK